MDSPKTQLKRVPWMRKTLNRKVGDFQFGIDSKDGGRLLVLSHVI
jgi:hypothetical protein